MNLPQTTEIDDHTRAGHKRFKKAIRFNATIDGQHIPLTWDEWMEWQATRDPIAEDPKTAERVRQQITDSRRGPGISRRR